MLRQTLILAAIAALALGYGLTRFQSLSREGEPSASPIGVGDKAGVPSGAGLTRAYERRNGNRASVEKTQEVTAPFSNIEQLDPTHALETASEKPPINLGEPLDVGDGEAWEPIVAGVDPIHIGPELDADEPLQYDRNESSGPPIDIGPRLNADDPGAGLHSTVFENPIDIGPYLDADNPWSGENLKAPSAPIEIGERLDAGAE